MNSESPTTYCLQCGAAVALAAVRDRFGRCEPCYARFTAGRNIAAHIPADAVVIASFLAGNGYRKGNIPDLTSWHTVMRRDGALTQTIDWHLGDKRDPEVREAFVNDERLSAIAKQIEAIDRLGIATLNRNYGMDGAASIVIVAPELGFHASTLLGVVTDAAHDESTTQSAKSGWETFQAAWKLIDAVGPYTMKMHRPRR
jgi:hypothetical protein